MIVRCPQCGEETRRREYSAEERVVRFLCPACDGIVRLDLAMDEVHSSSAATSYERTEHRKRVLVADDAELVRSLVTEILEEAGYEVFQAADGEETLLRVREEHPDLVLLDLVMPRLTGFEVLREMRRDERVRHIPVLAMSGVYKENILGWLQSMGASGFLDKDNVRDSLVFRVHTAISEPVPACAG